jgi:hypothetical protein
VVHLNYLLICQSDFSSVQFVIMKQDLLGLSTSLSAFRDRGVPEPTSECAACPSPDGSSAWASAKGGERERGRWPEPGRERERVRDGGSHGLRVRPAPRSGALAVGGYKRPHG